MSFGFLLLVFIWSCVSAAATPVPTADSNTLGTTSSSPTQTVVSGTGLQSTVTPTTTGAKHNELLRQELAISPASHRLRGRIVLANTRFDGSDEWGVTADRAEVACDRIARYQVQNEPQNVLMHTLLRRFIPVQSTARMLPMEGHLLSVGSGYEVMALSRLLNPLPQGSYWTGGRLTRYTVNSMKHPGHTDHVVLTWTDGRTGRPSVLGMTKADELQLREGYTYCLALNLQEVAWQARDCSDHLPYACLITPRQIGFSNHATRDKTTETITTKPQVTPATGGDRSTEAVSGSTQQDAQTTSLTGGPANTMATEGITLQPAGTAKVTLLADSVTTAGAESVGTTVLTTDQNENTEGIAGVAGSTVTPDLEPTTKLDQEITTTIIGVVGTSEQESETPNTALQDGELQTTSTPADNDQTSPVAAETTESNNIVTSTTTETENVVPITAVGEETNAEVEAEDDD